MNGNILQLKISLNDTRPPIWRRIQIAKSSSFLGLHAAIQDAFGWEGSHLHDFTLKAKKTGTVISIGPEDDDSLEDTFSEKRERLKHWLTKEGKQCQYTYDYGDNWGHTVLLEKILPEDPDVSYPRCVAGKRACPPEDSGGVWGYESKLEILKDPKHDEYEDVLAWMGEDFDPEAFEPKDVVFQDSSIHDIERIDEDMPIESQEDAMEELDHVVAGVPFEAIRYLREAKTSKELMNHIKYVLDNAYNDQVLDADVFHDTSPLWYANLLKEVYTEHPI